MTYYFFPKKEKIILPYQADNPAVIDILHNYTPGIEWEITFSEGAKHIIIGNAELCDRDGSEYVINITEGGIYIEGYEYKDTIHGFVSLMELVFCYGRCDYRAECGIVRDVAKIKMRSVHICFFPDYSVSDMRKVIRCCGMAKYSHIVLELWGNLKFDCMKELAWPNALSKDDVRPLIREAHALGIEIIPFYQHLGHAAMSRLGYSGKHVVLDQNLEYDYLYYPKSRGWVWNFMLDETKDLLRKVRGELIELCGDGQYFHLGCDESGLDFNTRDLSQYLNEVSDELKTLGRRAIIWGDMMLSRRFEELKTVDSSTVYECNSSPEYASAILDKLSRDIIVADWQYNVNEHPWRSSVLLKQKGFDVICCPWNQHHNIYCSIKTAESEALIGIMETTWNKLFTEGGIYRTVFAGLCAWGDPDYAYWFGTVAERTYNMYRRVSPQGQTYENCGWSKNQV